MERLVIVLIAAILCWMNSAKEEEVEVLLDRATKLNPDFYVDENAFMEVADALGFGSNSSVTADTDVGMRSQSIYSVSSDSENNVQSSADRNSNESQHNGNTRRGRYGRLAGMARSNN